MHTPNGTPPKVFPRLALISISNYCNPRQLLRLSEVNKSWNEVFTSDSVWRAWDAYGVENGICKHHKQSKSNFTERDWSYARRVYFEVPSNLYIRLYSHRCGCIEYLDTPPFTDSFARAISMRPLTGLVQFSQFSASVLRDEELVLQLLRVGSDPRSLPVQYKSNRRATLASLNFLMWYEVHYEQDYSFLDWFDRDIVDDKQFALEALEHDVKTWEALPIKQKHNPEVFDRMLELSQMSLATVGDVDVVVEIPESILGDKPRLRELLRCMPHLLHDYSDQCDRNGLDPDSTAVFNALARPSYLTNSFVQLPKELCKDISFVLLVCKTCPVALVSGLWYNFPPSLIMDHRFLYDLAKFYSSRPVESAFTSLGYVNRPGAECIAAFFQCKYPLNPETELGLVRDILSMGHDVFKKVVNKSQYGDYELKTEILVELLLAHVGVEYGERAGKRLRLE